jgi:TIR domain
LKPKIFISHSSSDTWITKQIEIELKKLDVTIFLDDGFLDVGDDFEKIILKELKSSDELVVLITPESIKRPYVWLEIGAAWIREIRIVGILHGITIEELSSDPKNPVLIKKSNLIHLNDFDKYANQLKKRLLQQTNPNG